MHLCIPISNRSSSIHGRTAPGACVGRDSSARVLGAEYEHLETLVERGKTNDIDAYGATSPAEFFAVVTEEFFENPTVLATRHPALYAELSAFYNFDPAARSTSTS